MAAKKKVFNNDQKRKILLIVRILLLTAAFLYLLFFFYNNYIADDRFELYFSNAEANYLQTEKRKIDPQQDLYLELFKELKAGPKNNDLGRTIPEGSELLGYQLEKKILTLNFNVDFKNNHWGGSTGELMTVYSIVNTYTSLSEVDSVKILITGKEVETLVGHLDLTEPLMYNQKLTGDN